MSFSGRRLRKENTNSLDIRLLLVPTISLWFEMPALPERACETGQTQVSKSKTPTMTDDRPLRRKLSNKFPIASSMRNIKTAPPRIQFERSIEIRILLYEITTKPPLEPQQHQKKEVDAASSNPTTARGKPGKNPNNLLTCSATIATRTQREGNQDKSWIAKLRRWRNTPPPKKIKLHR